MAKRKNKKPEAFYSYVEFAPIIRCLTDSDAGRLYKALYEFCFSDGAEPDFSDSERLDTLWVLMKAKLERDNYSWCVKSVVSSYKAYLRDFEPDKEHISPLPIGAWHDWKKRQLQQIYGAEKAFEIYPAVFKIQDVEDLPNVQTDYTRYQGYQMIPDDIN